jgi:hypothetical protein
MDFMAYLSTGAPRKVKNLFILTCFPRVAVAAFAVAAPARFGSGSQHEAGPNSGQPS